MKCTSRLLKILTAVGGSFLLLLAFLSTGAAQTLSHVWLQLSPTGTPPTPRWVAGSGYDELNDRLILFSGEDPNGLPYPSDVWVLVNASGAGGPPSWTQLAPTGGPPPGRVVGTVVYDPISNRLIIHGGCIGHCIPGLSDVWVLTHANGLGGTPTWIQLPNAPIPRVYHSAVYDPGSNRMIVFGGAHPSTEVYFNDVRVLIDANGIGTPSWVQLFPTGTLPQPRRDPAVVYDQVNNRLIVFGGYYDDNHHSLNDVWVLTHANGLGGTPAWTQLSPTGAPPAARYSSEVAYDQATNQLLIFGGGAAAPSPPDLVLFDDVWVLSQANGLGGTPQWSQTQPAGCGIPARIYAFGGYSQASKHLIVAMGYNDQLSPHILSDVWVLKEAASVTSRPCSLTVTKTADWGGLTPVPTETFDICLTGPSYPTGSEAGACQSLGPAGGSLAWDTLSPADYTLTETTTTPAWWEVNLVTSPTTVLTTSGATAQVINTYRTASLTLLKEAGDDTQQQFDFTFEHFQDQSQNQTFSLTGGQTKSFTPLPTGVYTLTELTTPGWTLLSAACLISGTTDSPSFTPISDTTDTLIGTAVSLQPDQDVICTFTNQPDPPAPTASLTILKEAGSNTQEHFDFTLIKSLDPGSQETFSLQGGQAKEFTLLPAGRYTITEITSSNWVLLSVSCQITGATTPANFTPLLDPFNTLVGAAVHLEPDQDVLCTFTNNRPNIDEGAQHRLYLPLLLKSGQKEE